MTANPCGREISSGWGVLFSSADPKAKTYVSMKVRRLKFRPRRHCLFFLLAAGVTGAGYPFKNRGLYTESMVQSMSQ